MAIHDCCAVAASSQPTVEERRVRVSDNLKLTASKMSTFMQQTMSGADFGQYTYTAINLYPKLREKINALPGDKVVNGNLEEAASEACETLIVYDTRGPTFKSICKQMQLVMVETADELQSKYPISEVKKRALGTVTNELYQIETLCAQEKKDWHKAFQKILPIFVSLHNKGLFDTTIRLRLFAHCRPITMDDLNKS